MSVAEFDRWQTPVVRIGTWNLDARWTPAHADLLVQTDCDVWLLTEVHPCLVLPGYTLTATAGAMQRGQAWAGVVTRLPMRVLPEPHPASVAVEVDGLTFCSSVLPWASCGNDSPWVAGSLGEKTAAAVRDLVEALPPDRTVWGGDWNHTLDGTLSGSSRDGRTAILAALDELGLGCQSATLPHRLAGMNSIDHLAVPRRLSTSNARRVAVPTRLSDHDAYCVELPFGA